MASPSFDFAAVAGVELPPNVRYVGIRHRDASLPVGRTLNMLSRNRFTADTGSPPYSNLPYLQGGTGIRSVGGASELG
jgi:hypothetical protein